MKSRRDVIGALASACAIPGAALAQTGSGTCTGEVQLTTGGSISARLEDSDYHGRAGGPFAGQVTENDLLSATVTIPFPETSFAIFDRTVPSNYRTLFPHRSARLLVELQSASPSWNVGAITFGRLHLYLPNYLVMQPDNSARSFLQDVQIVVGNTATGVRITGLRDYVANSHWADNFIPLQDWGPSDPNLRHTLFMNFFREWRAAQAAGQTASVRATSLRGQPIEFALPPAPDGSQILSSANTWLVNARRRRAAGQCGAG